MAREQLSCFPTTLQHDIDMTNKAHGNRMMAALMYRIEHKQFLLALLDIIEEIEL